MWGYFEWPKGLCYPQNPSKSFTKEQTKQTFAKKKKKSPQDTAWEETYYRCV